MEKKPWFWWSDMKDKSNGFFTDLAPRRDCKNPDSYGQVCVKCNKCGRFNERYIIIRDGKE